MGIRKMKKVIECFINDKALGVADDGDGSDSSSPSSAGADGDSIAEGGNGKPIAGAGVFSSATRSVTKHFRVIIV